MDLALHYDSLYNESVIKIQSGNYQTDNIIDSSTDNRFGITLVVRPDEQIKNRIQTFINELKTVDPNQYYYPNSDIHVTVLSIIACFNEFDLATISLPSYVELIEKCLTTHKKFDIEFKGVTASASCILIQGFISDNTLNDIRDDLRIGFSNSKLEQSIDKRYSIQTAHSSVVRFRQPLTNVEEFIKITDHYRNYHFGTFTVNSIELVCNDWYHREKNEKELHIFDL